MKSLNTLLIFDMWELWRLVIMNSDKKLTTGLAGFGLLALGGGFYNLVEHVPALKEAQQASQEGFEKAFAGIQETVEHANSAMLHWKEVANDPRVEYKDRIIYEVKNGIRESLSLDCRDVINYNNLPNSPLKKELWRIENGVEYGIIPVNGLNYEKMEGIPMQTQLSTLQHQAYDEFDTQIGIHSALGYSGIALGTALIGILLYRAFQKRFRNST
jgi:hypothetical protein